MVWSKHDFEREVRRQLVEIESIRKRLPESPEVRERIDRLSASHRTLIRKLDEVFPANSKAPAARPGSSQTTARGSSPTTGPRRNAPKRGRNQAHAGRQNPARNGPGASAHGRYQIHAHKAALSKKKVTVPGIHEKCAACGKVLLASVLLGREVVFLNEAWYHRNCASKGSLN